MKRNLALLSILAAFSLTATIAFAGAGGTMRVVVPFDFYLEDQLVPAGEYAFEMASVNSVTSSAVTVRSDEGEGIRLLLTMPGTESDAAANCLRFNKYGEKYFLSSISIRGHKANLKTFQLEKELRSQVEKAERTTTIAQN
jgi:hypothetical protein